ncbi:MAG TPA: insulinase family protein [Chlamydiales bacterium]|nr:insulinase family protein [Chlamydiales bacterium]
MKLAFIAIVLGAILNHFGYKFSEISDRSELPLLNPDFSERKTLKMRLNNGLELLLISDPKADNSAAAVAIHAGSWNDPTEFPGMAHFCEHMLFMGTRKYPDENEFMAKVADQGGMTNALTASDKTVYMFSSNSESFPRLLDQFVHFFVDPLFKPSNISREMHAVDQEFAKNMENDGWRLSMIFKELGNPVHPNRMFSCGNSETLSHIPQSALQKWHREHYSADRMRAVLYSSLKMETLKELAVLTFNEVPVSSPPSAIDPSLPLTSREQRGSITYIQPIQDKQSLIMLWELPPALSIDSTQSASLLAYTLNRGQKHNLYEMLKEEQLIDRLTVNVDDIGGMQHKFFEISMELTEIGIKKIDQICLKVFQALSLIQTTGVPHYLFQEKNHLSQINYQYQSREEAFSLVTQLGLNLLNEPLETYPKNQLLGSVYSPKMIVEAASFLTPDRCVFLVLGAPALTGVSPDRQEKWLGAEYAMRPIPQEWMHAWENATPISQIRLPEPNPFVPTQLELVAETPNTKLPLLLSQNEHGCAYFAQFPEFNTPEAAIRIHILSPELNPSSKSQVLSALFCAHLTDRLHPILSAALDTNLKASIQPERSRIHIKIDGFSEKAPILLQEILHQLPLESPSREYFEHQRLVLEKNFANSQKDLGFRQAKDLLDSLITQDKISKREKLAALKTIQYEDYLAFQKNVLEKTYIEALFSGNLTVKDAESVWLDVIHVIGKTPFLKQDHPVTKVAHLPTNPYSIKQTIKAQGNAALLAIDLGPFTLAKRASQEILSIALKDAFFNEMRTRQKTGYFATAEAQEIEEELYQFLVVQSNSHQPEDLLYRYELFLEEFLEDFSTHISKERFMTLQESAAALHNLHICNLKEKSNLFDLLAFQYRADFHFLDKRIAAIRNLSYEEFCANGIEFLSRKNKRRLAILMEGKLASPFFYEMATPNQISEIATYAPKPEKLPDDSPSDIR